MHCGFCLPTCPTYLLWGEEMDSPRGRIYLMKAGVEGRTAIDANYVRHFDACLGCVSCVTACPSGVQYGPLIEQTRAQIENEYERPALDRLFRRGLLSVVPYPMRMRLALLPMLLFGWLIRKIAGLGSRREDASDHEGPARNGGRPAMSAGRAFMARLFAAIELAPPVTWRGFFGSTRERTPAQGDERMTVAVLTGCVQRISFADV